MRRVIASITLLLAIALPLALAAAPSSKIEVATDGFPVGQDTPEGAAAGLARAFIDKDPDAFKHVAIRIYSQGNSGTEYGEFLSGTVAHMAAEKSRPTPSPSGPKAIEKVFMARQLRSRGPASYGHASFGFQDVVFVDVVVLLHNGQRALNRTLVIKDGDGRWYAHPAPHVSPLLSQGLTAESQSKVDFAEAGR